jgi:CheY-like chemotaxis protein
LARKILLADDSVTAQNMGRKILADAGYEVIAVNNGSAALKKIAETKPDLVVLDVYMPGYSGLEVCQRLKESGETARIPVLLTVGKLEPFKPEEAQRVRAEGFIVKPFEASELLSALSKLEDKVVPRAEPSRSGRFARAIAAVEQSGRERAGEDNGWKNRIGFPHEKTEAEVQAEKADLQASTYNALNRDLRTIAETPEEKAQNAARERHEDTKHKGRKEDQEHDSSARDTKTVDVAALAPSGVPSSGLPKDVTQEELAAITAAAAQIQVATASQEQEQRASESERETGPRPDLATVGFEPPIREIDLDAAAPSVAEPPAVTNGSDVRLTEQPQDFGSHDSKESQDVPVTMAATAESVASSGTSRWTAVAVALENHEAGISLDHEMEKASAAGMTTDSAASGSALSEIPSASAETRAPEVSQEVAGTTESAAALSIESVAPVTEKEASALAMPMGFRSGQGIESIEPESLPVQQPETGDAGVVTRDTAAMASAPETYAPEEIVASTQAVGDDSADQRSAPVEFSTVSAEAQSAPDFSDSTQRPEAEPAEGSVESGSGYRAFYSGEPVSESNSEPQPAADNENVKSTAAAWASWRQIRDTGKAEPQDRSRDLDRSEPAETNAAAAAAGAEQSLSSPVNPEESGNPSDVASIVDSVLADLRPKLMKEISRKMAEKK